MAVTVCDVFHSGAGLDTDPSWLCPADTGILALDEPDKSFEFDLVHFDVGKDVLGVLE